MTDYKQAGVDIDKGNELVKAIKPFAKSTKRAGVSGELGGFGALFDLKACNYKDPILVSATDGVGTKLKIAQQLNDHSGIGIDLVAMCVNDLVVQGAEPLFFLDYFACGKLDNIVATEVVKSIAQGCKQANCALIGGETAEMPGMYKDEDYDLAGFAVGAVEREEILPNVDIKTGDVLIGLPSSGIHSNGYSLVRKVIADNNIDLDSEIAGSKLSELLIAPTKIYVKECLAVIKQNIVKALCHITGGGFTENLPRILPENAAAHIDITKWQQPAIFSWLQEQGKIEQDEMLKTFNCGIGMVLVVSAEKLAQAMQILDQQNSQAIVIGEIIEQKTAKVEYYYG